MATFDNIDTFVELRDAISSANGNAEADTINITGNITLDDGDPATDDSLPLIDETAGLTINGGGYTLSGNNQHRIFFVKSGNITLDGLNFTQGKAQGANGGGGGAGMGGALFIYDGSVTVSNAAFSSNQAIGGSGGNGRGGGIGLDFLGNNGANGIGYNAYGGSGGFGGSGGNGSGGSGHSGGGGSGGFGGGGGGGGNSSNSHGGRGGKGGFGGGGGSGGFGFSYSTIFGHNGGGGGYGGGGGGSFSNNSGYSYGYNGYGSGGFGGGFGNNSNGIGGGGAGMGGAAFIRSGSLNLANVAFDSNTATGGTGAQSGQGLGGAIFALKRTSNTNGNNQGMPTTLPTVTFDNTVTFTGNVAAQAADQTQNSIGADLNSAAVYRFLPNQVPTIATATLNGTDGNLSVDEGSTVTLVATATDAEADTLTFTLDGTAAGEISGAAGSIRTSNPIERLYTQDGTAVLTYAVTDSISSVTTTRTVTIVNVAPTITAATLNGVDGAITVDEGSTIALQMSATDPGADILTFTIDGAAAGTGGSLPSSTRTSDSSTKTVDDNGTVVVQFQASDDDTSTVGDRTITVVNVAPTATLSNSGSVTPGSASVSFAGQADVSTADTAAGFRYAYDFDNNGTFDLGDGTYSGSQTAASASVPNSFLVSAGAKTVRARILDKDGGFSDYTTTLGVVNAAPTISGTAPISVDEDTLYSFTPTAIDPDAGDTLTFLIVNRPTWATFDPATGRLSGTPTNSSVGTTNAIRISVNDQSGAVANLPTFDLTVSNVNDAPTLQNAIADKVATVGSPFSFTIPANTFADVDAEDTLTLSAAIANGSPLPTWLTFNAATGQFSGNPTANNVGAIDIKVTTTDSANASVSDVFSFTVQPQADGTSGETGIPTTRIFLKPTKGAFRSTGTDKADVLKGSPVKDILKGLKGNDVLKSGFSKAKFGQDMLYGGAGNDILISGAGKDLLHGNAGDDRLIAGKGRDFLLGDSGRDLLNGGAGDDILVGGQGNDTLVGGQGEDMFVFDLNDGTDVIKQFESSSDVIDLRSIFRRSEFSGTSAFDQYQKYVQLVQVGSNTEVQIDADGSGQGTQFVTLASLQNVSAGLVNSTQFVIR